MSLDAELKEVAKHVTIYKRRAIKHAGRDYWTAIINEEEDSPVPFWPAWLKVWHDTRGGMSRQDQPGWKDKRDKLRNWVRTRLRTSDLNLPILRVID